LLYSSDVGVGAEDATASTNTDFVKYNRLNLGKLDQIWAKLRQNLGKFEWCWAKLKQNLSKFDEIWAKLRQI